MQTSYFGNPIVKNDSRAVSIARWPPRWWGRRARFIALAPPRDLVKRYKAGLVQWPEYCQEYNAVLNALDVETVFNALSPDSILLCYERPGENCHRHLVAEWFEKTLGISVPEL